MLVYLWGTKRRYDVHIKARKRLDVNHYEIEGRVGHIDPLKPPEGTAGHPSLRLRVATRGSDGSTTWHTVSLQGENATFADANVRVGFLVYAKGEFRTKSWQEKGGAKRAVSYLAAREFELLDAGVVKPITDPSIQEWLDAYGPVDDAPRVVAG